MIAKVEGRNTDKLEHSTVYKPELVVRHSTAKPKGRLISFTHTSDSSIRLLSLPTARQSECHETKIDPLKAPNSELLLIEG
ncbi:hypothetical protein PO124_33245 [Bacillus licheniformis]|nr:hypothetical protein [Bacillus licheniformis]